MMIAEISITPIGKGESISLWVSRAVEVIERSGLKHQVGPLGTCIEGEWEQIAPVVGECLRVLSRDCPRISVSLRADYRANSARSMEDTVRSVARTLGHSVVAAGPVSG